MKRTKRYPRNSPEFFCDLCGHRLLSVQSGLGCKFCMEEIPCAAFGCKNKFKKHASKQIYCSEHAKLFNDRRNRARRSGPSLFD